MGRYKVIRTYSPQTRERMSAAAKRRHARAPDEWIGENNPNWRGGKSSSHGYIVLRDPNHHRSHGNGYVLEHVAVMERTIGRPLSPNEIIHHIDGDKRNNDPMNLALLSSQAEHALSHRWGRFNHA